LKNEALPAAELDIKDIGKLVEEVVGKSHSVNKQETDKKLKEEERSILVGWEVDTSAQTDALNDEITELGYRINDEKISAEYKVRYDYNNILNLRDDIEISKLNYDKAVKLQEVTKLKYDMGLVTALENTKAQGDVDDAWEANLQAKLNYYLAVEDFKNYIAP
jgi:outer membrane protein TolC